MTLARTERWIGLGAAGVAGALMIASATVLPVWSAALLWTAFLVGLAALSRQGWLKLVGPVLLYDMIRTARRERYFVMRMLYAGLLLFILYYLILVLSLADEGQILERQRAVIAQSFFLTFTVVQLFVVVFLTPAYVSGAIAEEKDKKTLEYLMATDLRDGEIIMSKLLSRLANMSLLLITGLPILSILQFLGGVDAELVLAGFAAVGLTMLGIAGVSMMVSTMARKPRDAISLAYLLLFAYAALGCIGMWLRGVGVPLMSTPISFGDEPYTVNDAVDVFNAGNPITACVDVGWAISGQKRGGGATTLVAELPGILSRYAWFHLGLAFVTIGWSIWRMRPIALKHNSEVKVIKTHWWDELRPRIGQSPMLWKELFIEGRLKQPWLFWVVLVFLIAPTLLWGFGIIGSHMDADNWTIPNWGGLKRDMNIWFRIVGTAVACLMLMMAAVRASTSITNERDRDTLDALVTTPMTALAMLSAKLLGNLVSARLVWLWFGSILTMAVCTGGLHPLAVPLIVFAWFVYALLGVMIGLWYSMVCKSSMLATFYTVPTCLFVGGGHWLILYCCGMPLAMVMFLAIQKILPGFEPPLFVLEFLGKFLAGLTPPAVFAFAGFGLDDLGTFQFRTIVEGIVFYLVGLFLWLFAAGIMWFAMLMPRFRRITRRIELIYK